MKQLEQFARLVWQNTQHGWLRNISVAGFAAGLLALYAAGLWTPPPVSWLSVLVSGGLTGFVLTAALRDVAEWVMDRCSRQDFYAALRWYDEWITEQRQNMAILSHAVRNGTCTPDKIVLFVAGWDRVLRLKERPELNNAEMAIYGTDPEQLLLPHEELLQEVLWNCQGDLYCAETSEAFWQTLLRADAHIAAAETALIRASWLMENVREIIANGLQRQEDYVCPDGQSFRPALQLSAEHQHRINIVASNLRPHGSTLSRLLWYSLSTDPSHHAALADIACQILQTRRTDLTTV